MSKQREALQLALEALNTSVFDLHDAWRGLTYAENKLQEIQAKASDAIRSALAEPEQEPVAWMCPYDPERETAFSWRAGMCESSGCGHQRIPLYTAPPARKPLTVEQVEDEWERITGHSIFGGDRKEGRAMYLSPDEVMEFARAIERAHGIGD